MSPIYARWPKHEAKCEQVRSNYVSCCYQISFYLVTGARAIKGPGARPSAGPRTREGAGGRSRLRRLRARHAH